MEEVPIRVPWEMLPASTERFYHSCTVACSKFIQRAQKVKGWYNVREFEKFLQVSCIIFYFMHDGNNQYQHITQVVPKVSALFRH